MSLKYTWPVVLVQLFIIMVEQHVNFYFRSILGIFIFYSTLPEVEKQAYFSGFSTSPCHVISTNLLKTVRSMRPPPVCSICLRGPPTRTEFKWNGLDWIVGGPSLPMVRLWKTACKSERRKGDLVRKMNGRYIQGSIRWGGHSFVTKLSKLGVQQGDYCFMTQPVKLELHPLVPQSW